MRCNDFSVTEPCVAGHLGEILTVVVHVDDVTGRCLGPMGTWAHSTDGAPQRRGTRHLRIKGHQQRGQTGDDVADSGQIRIADRGGPLMHCGVVTDVEQPPVLAARSQVGRECRGPDHRMGISWMSAPNNSLNSTFI